MTAPVLLSAGDSTPGRLQCVDVNLTNPVNSAAPVWTPIQFIESCDLNPDDPAMVDATVFGDKGYSGQDKLGAAWSCTLVLNHMSVPGSNPPAYDSTHNYLETKGPGVFGAANRVQLRFYDFDLNDPTGVVTPRGIAYMGFANYAWPRFGSVGQAEGRKVSVQFMGKGALNVIAHPYPLTPVVPTVSDFRTNPMPVAGGKPFRILGSAFTGTTGVTLGGTAATQIQVIADNEIIGLAPAHASGTSLPVVVTNAVGPSTALNTVTYS